ncbi:MAG: molybdate ABC transporter substrate-binding protein [Aestuariivita sp.]|jgi:molybdate transport system substrate-binding protein|nr:molybdate ABC transporter substrate-binding protein [Aestuariivita sp.]
MDMRRFGLSLTLILGLWPSLGWAQPRDIVVFAAASLKNVLDEAVAAFETETDHDVVVSFGGSSALARQIQQGAPADIFISANVLWMEALQGDGLILPESRTVLAGNRLVLVGLDGDPVDLQDPGALSARLAPDDRLAMALVDAVPAGIYGKTALQNLGLWSGIVPFVAQTGNVRAALRLVSLGEARMGVVYATDAHIDSTVTVLATFPASSHPPIRYPAALTAERTHPDALAFLRFLRGAQGQTLFARYGFLTGIAE